jgi:predicted ATPase/DNA-binding SARP family transcriptional activator
MTDAAPTDVVSARVALLGRFEIVVGGREVVLRSGNERALFTRLALQPGTVVSVEALIEAVWPNGSQPNDPVKSLRFHVWHLRDALEPARPERSEGRLVRTQNGGYVLDVADEAVDAIRVEREWKRAQTIAGLAERRELLVRVLADWQRPAFADGDPLGPLGDAAVRLERLRLAVLEDRIAIDLELGGGAELVHELEQLAVQHPFREQLIGQRMRALYRAGRQVEALAVYAEARGRLVEELGLEPGPELRALEQRILAHDPQLAATPSSAPPAPAPTRLRSGNLPLSADSFVGRAAIVNEVHELLAGHRLITLAGAGGAGKTRLAIEAARGVGDRFPDGVWFVDLAPVVEAAQAILTVAETWQLRSGELTVDDLVVEHLRHRAVLLVIDNCEHVLDPVATLVRRLLHETATVRVLATSRAALSIGGERVLRVPSLAVVVDGAAGPAMELFVERGRSARSGWEPTGTELDAIRAICDRLDGIPLAVELVAARVRSMSPPEILHLLNGSPLALVGSNRSAVPRQRTLAATVDWSYQLLPELDREVFRRLSVFAGGFDLDAAVAMCDDMTLNPFEVADIVDALVDRSLVLAVHRAAATRYRMLEPVRQWAASRPGDPERLRRDHARHYAELVATLAPRLQGHGQADAFRRIEADLPNLRVAFDTLANDGDVDGYLDMAFRLYGYWVHRGPRLESFQICRRGLELASRLGADPERHAKVGFVATMCVSWTRRRIALEVADRCRALAEQLDSPRALGWSALARATVVVNAVGSHERADVAADHMIEARQLFEAHPGPAWWDPRWERGMQLMLYAAFLTPAAERVPEFEESERIMRECGDEAMLVALYSQCSPLADVMGRDRVMELLARGAVSTASPEWANTCRATLAHLHQLSGEHEQAVGHLRVVYSEDRIHDDTAHTGRGRALAVSLCALGLIDEARQVITDVIGASGPQLVNRDLLRCFAVAAIVLAASASHDVAALALGAAHGEDEGWHDALSRVRPQLADVLGADRLAELESEGAALDADTLGTRIRAALAPPISVS